SGGGCLRFDTGCRTDADATSATPGEDQSTKLPSSDAVKPTLTESNVALCITVTLSHTWSQFCSRMEDFRHGVADVLSSELRATVRPRQVVIEDHCGHRKGSRLDAIAENDTAVVQMHLMDDHDQYSQKLTALAAVILHHNDQGRMNLQMMNVCFYSRQHSTPSLLPSDAHVYGPASSSVIASITISAIAGASLFLICILLVVLRQRLLNKHSTTNTVDGLSLASFKSSFRKKTIRNSLRSFLNDAFDGHEDLSSPVPFNNLPLIISNKEALEEEFKQRCAPYFPQNTLDCHKLYGDYQVSLQAKDVRPSFTLSTFKLHDLDKNLCRDVYHCWYTAWPSQGVPEDVSSVVGFLIEARRYVSRNQGPTVVHCR
ncbi:unnamed protein product, partial [Ixodes hexagonus]